MNRNREIVLKATLKTLNTDHMERLLSFLTEEEKNGLLALPDIQLNTDQSVEPLIDLIHWSWFIPILENYPSKDRTIFLRAFPTSMQKSICKFLQVTPSTEKLTRFGINFLKNELFRTIFPENIIPVEYLPSSPLNTILQIEKKKLIKLIDYLSMFDLSRELRQIVETKILKKIYSFLSDDEKQFLKIAGSQKEPYTTAQIHLDQWDGSKKSFRRTLHRLGLARLGSALSGQDPDLIWYICHQLDIGRGMALEKLCKNDPIPGVAEWLAEQMKELV